MLTPKRISFWLRVIGIAVTAIFASGWLYLYLDSRYKRQKAEHLIEDIKAFPFSTAGFADVRELAIRYGGTARQRDPFSTPSVLPPELPVADRDGRVQIPSLRTGPICTDRNCAFDIIIEPLPYRLWLEGRFRLAQSVLARLGLRPWAVGVNLEVRDGKLWEIEAGMTQCVFTRLEHTILFPLGYSVVVRSMANAIARHRATAEYGVGFPIITGFVGRFLSANLVEPSPASVQRAFDFHLRCVTTILHGCRSFGEIAPSAWTDYQREHNLEQGR